MAGEMLTKLSIFRLVDHIVIAHAAHERLGASILVKDVRCFSKIMAKCLTQN